ncbi:MAG TPA: helix-turn-helix transcriptional regulator [Candidatus Deferrimicrobium sp.]|nr:helix-turn-helix transcriptional regulator [Candidatus Deferrimicrobium sp.]
MDRKSLLRAIGERLKKAREPFKLSQNEMADHLGVYRSSYSRYESGRISPQMLSLYKLATENDISMDWLIADKGPMYYGEREKAAAAGTLGEDVDELLNHMKRIPLLRHEVLVLFYKFKEDHKDLVENAGKG